MPLVGEAVDADHDGRVARWTMWWPCDVIEFVLADPVVRDRIADTCPRVPRTFWDHEIPLPARWAPAGFVVLGVAYREEVGCG